MLGKHVPQKKRSLKGFLLNYSVQYSVCSPLVFTTDLSPWNTVYIFLANRSQAFPGVCNTILQFFFVHVGAFLATICLIHSKFLCLYLNQVTSGQGTKTVDQSPQSLLIGRKFYLLE